MNYITKRRALARNSPGRASLGLIELAVLLLVFAFSAAVCMNLFAAAASDSRLSSELSWARTEVSAAAELYKSGSDIQSEYYSKDYTKCDISSAIYELYASDAPDGGVKVAAARLSGGERQDIFCVEAVRIGG